MKRETHFNKLPLGGMQEITHEQYYRDLFMYAFGAPYAKAIEPFTRKGYGLRLLPLRYGGDHDVEIGLAISEHRSLNNVEYKYYRYGGQQRWKEYNQRLSAQFAGDNS